MNYKAKLEAIEMEINMAYDEWLCAKDFGADVKRERYLWGKYVGLKIAQDYLINSFAGSILDSEEPVDGGNGD